MKNFFTAKLGRFKFVAALEGISFLMLVGVAIPLKYVWGKPAFVQHMGLVHGITFVLYIFSIIQHKIECRWATGKTVIAMLLSVVPFGTFYVASKMIPQLMIESDKKYAE